MQFTNLGNTGLIVSRIAFGAMTFGEGTLVGELKTNINQKQAIEMIDRCLAAGVNFFDTADMYTAGQSEIMLGNALKNKRHDVVIATKCGFRSGNPITSTGLSYRYILQAVQASLKRLGTDYIDLFLLHIPDPFTPLEETCRALEHVVQQGWVRYVGYCNYPAWQAQKMIDLQQQNNLTRVICAQMYYSLLGRDIEKEVVPFLKANKLGLMVWSPLASGFLSGKYTSENPVPPESRRAKFDFPPVDLDRGYEVVATLQTLAKKYKASIAQLALAWLLSKNFVSTILIGATKIEQLEDNLGAVDIKLDAEDIQMLDEQTATPDHYPAWMQPMGYDMKITEGLS
jgi:aryl-alcohol dehydrogenase-like predicted oxidoreductase